MKIWIAREWDTLRSIANEHHIPTEDLLALNPHIHGPDQRIAGYPVRLPTTQKYSRPQTSFANLPICPTDPVTPLYHWFPLTPLEEMANREYDVLIVGTGAGGGAALWRLCERFRGQNLRIGIIDRGDLLLPTHARNLPMMTTERITRYFHTVSRPLPGAGPDYPGARQLFAFGGRTLFWYAFAIRMNFALLPDWPIPLDEMESFYNIAEQHMNVTRAEDASFTEVLLNRLWEHGFSGAGHIPLATDTLPSVFGRIHTDIFNSSVSFLSTALNIRPFDAAVNARAVEIMHEEGKVTGVKVMTPDKSAYTLQAKTVVLSASTFETPRLLLHSGIHHPALGHYLMNHSFVQATGTISTEQFHFPMGTLGIIVPSAIQRPYQLLMAGPATFYWVHTTEIRPFALEESVLFFGYGQVNPRYENRITLDPFKKDAYGVPEVEVQYSFSPEEKAVIGQLAEGIERVASATGIRLTSQNGRPPVCLTPAGDLHHDSGTCRIGNDPSTSVADQYGQVRGVSGLFVADNSALPYIGAENPTLTTIALAIRTADYIGRTWSG
ncbi:GMC oxidoreductase [Paenibacillus sedimenti]|nr:GMC oxidoreductase [Paenibacillus sedimenti]